MNCKICGNTENNQIINVRERMFGIHEEFPYFNCAVCGCLQIGTPPENMIKYYPSDKYGSLANTYNRKSLLKKYLYYALVSGYLKGLVSKDCRYIRNYRWLDALKHLTKDSAILDIGCGTGYLLQEIHYWGYNKLIGIDPFIERNIVYPSGVQIFKFDVNNYLLSIEVERDQYKIKNFDLIMMHHSFEHMNNPHEVLQQCYKLLMPNGRLLIRVPVVDSFAYRKYGINWYQIDAPRHFYLYTLRSIYLLAQANGFKLEKIVYDSTPNQFVVSEQYCKDILWNEREKVSTKQMDLYKKEAKRLNTIHDGDQACFILKKSNAGK